MGPVEDSPTEPSEAGAPEQPSLDELNLQQALIDFEVANRRVIDLTARLTTLHAEHLQTLHDLQEAKLVVAEHRRDLDSIGNSRSYRLAVRLVSASRMIRR
jgi:hypothetical protein